MAAFGVKERLRMERTNQKAEGRKKLKLSSEEKMAFEDLVTVRVFAFV